MANLLKIEKLSYPDYLDLKDNLHRVRFENVIDDIWLLTSHSPGAFTLGRSFKGASVITDEKTIRASGREIYEIERGGDVTYHGPSQVMLYPFMEVPDRDIERFVRNLEQVAIDILAVYGLMGDRNPGYPGIWCNGAKIASIGLAVRKWVTFHGMAFNHMSDDGGFGMIIPCGIKGVRMTSLEEEVGHEIERAELQAHITHCIENVFNCTLTEIVEPDIKRILTPKHEQRKTG